MTQKTEETYGSIKISDEVMTVCAVNAVLRTQGVHQLASGFMSNLSMKIPGAAQSRGIRITRDRNEVTVDANIIVDYNVKIPQVAWDVQVNVKNELEHMTGCEVQAVNIRVQGVHIPDEEEIND